VMEATGLRWTLLLTVIGKLQRRCEQPKTRSKRLISLLPPLGDDSHGDDPPVNELG
jgi:hypothetical protein